MYQRLAESAKTFCWLIALLTIGASTANGAENRSQQISDLELKVFLEQNVGRDLALQDRFDAEVWLAGMRYRMRAYKIDEDESLEILKSVYREASESELPPDLVLAVIAIESSFNRFAISSVGAQGLMQVMPFWKREIGRPNDNLTDIATNIRYGCKILQFYIEKENGNIARALARYNGSTGKTWYSERVLVAWEQRWRSGRL